MSISSSFGAVRDQITLAQGSLPFRPEPGGPTEVEEKMASGLDLGWLIFIALLLIGAGAMVVSVVLKKSEGASENVTTNVARVGMGIIAFGMLAPIIEGLLF